MRECTLCLLFEENPKKIILGMKKRGFGAFNYNGFGGGIETSDKTIEEGAVRELYEEIKIKAKKEDLKKIGVLNFTFPHKREWDHLLHVYFLYEWKGEPQESEEMKPERFDIDNIPYDKMWDADNIWIPMVLQGKKIKASFTYNDKNKVMDNYKIKTVQYN